MAFLLRISGKVQGVFFRDSTKKKADELGLKGYVRNMADNTVEIVVENSDNLQEFIDWCWKGSPSAKVENVDIQNYELKETFNNFQIR